MISDKHCYIPNWTAKRFTKSFRVPLLNEESCSAHMPKTEFKISPKLGNIICLDWRFWARIEKEGLTERAIKLCKLNKSLLESSISVGIHRQKVCIP